jgi:hypothetical protein
MLQELRTIVSLIEVTVVLLKEFFLSMRVVTGQIDSVILWCSEPKGFFTKVPRFDVHVLVWAGKLCRNVSLHHSVKQNFQTSFAEVKVWIIVGHVVTVFILQLVH